MNRSAIYCGITTHYSTQLCHCVAAKYLYIIIEIQYSLYIFKLLITILNLQRVYKQLNILHHTIMPDEIV